MAVRKKARSRSQLAKSASGRKKIPGKTAAAEENRVEVPGSQRPPAKGAVRIKDADPRSKVEVTLTLRGPKLPGADQLSGRALAPKAVETRFSAPRRDADRVSQVLRKFGLKIEEVSLETRSMRVSGSVAMMEAAFHPGLGIYRNADQGEFRDRQGDYKIPAELKGIVTAVLGFGERRVVRRKPANATKIVHRLTPLTPADLERYYSFPQGDAAGQKIAIAEFGGGYFASDLSAYCKKFHRLVPTIKAISIGAPIRTLKQILRLPKARRQDELDSSGEVMMDVQIVAGLCSGATISVYFAKFNQKGWVDLLNRAIQDRPVVLSVSWGSAEDSSDWSEAARNAVNDRLNLAAMLGITICAASGDDGSGDEQTDERAHIDFPSSSPFVLAVGGTMIAHKAENITEEVWRVAPGWRSPSGGGATGGGVSALFSRPKWQDVKIASLNSNSITGRVVPDVAALAGPPWYALVFRGKKDYGGGTSASAPLWAALIARINALLPAGKQQRYLTPLLYRKLSNGVSLGRATCHDITIGHNASNPKPGIGYKATKGFDAVSGWGTPIGRSLLSAL